MVNVFDGAPVAFVVFFVVAAALVVLGSVLAVVSAFRNARNLRRSGIDPLAAESELMLRLTAARGTAGTGAPGGTVEERLAELGRPREA